MTEITTLADLDEEKGVSMERLLRCYGLERMLETEAEYIGLVYPEMLTLQRAIADVLRFLRAVRNVHEAIAMERSLRVSEAEKLAAWPDMARANREVLIEGAKHGG